jgi:tetratricopeptide (TPR) repeat protein
MRRFFLLLLLVAVAVPLNAQIGKQPIIQAGSPEDRALREIDAAADPAQKIELLDKFMAEHGKGDIVLLAYERYITAYLASKQYDKAFEAGEKALAVDPDNFGIAYTLVGGAAEKNDARHAFRFGERLGQMVERYKAAPAPEGVDAETWEERRRLTLDGLQSQIEYAGRLLYTVGYQVSDPVARAAMLERYLAAFPNSPFNSDAQVVITDSYDQAREPARKVAFAQKVLSREPDNFRMLVVLADHWATQREQLETAEQYARKALQLIPQAEKPEYLNDDQWEQRKNLQTGLARSALGQVYAHLVRDREAVDTLKGASPLLKPYPFYYGRNLYFLGFVLARMKRTLEAREVLTEAVAVDSPYRQLAQETLNKIGGPRRPAKKSE